METERHNRERIRYYFGAPNNARRWSSAWKRAAGYYREKLCNQKKSYANTIKLWDEMVTEEIERTNEARDIARRLKRVAVEAKELSDVHRSELLPTFGPLVRLRVALKDVEGLL